MLNILWLSMCIIYETPTVLGEEKGSREGINEMNNRKERYFQSIILVPAEDLYDNKVGFDGDRPDFSGILKALLTDSTYIKKTDVNSLSEVEYESMMPFLYMKKKEELVKNEHQKVLIPSAARLSLNEDLDVSLPNISVDVRSDKGGFSSKHISDKSHSHLNTRDINGFSELSEVELAVLPERMLNDENKNEAMSFDRHESLSARKPFLESYGHDRIFKRYSNNLNKQYDLDKHELRTHGSENTHKHSIQMSDSIDSSDTPEMSDLGQILNNEHNEQSVVRKAMRRDFRLKRVLREKPGIMETPMTSSVKNENTDHEQKSDLLSILDGLLPEVGIRLELQTI